MTQEEKDLLIQDLCARLPYGVKCERYGKAYELVEIDIKRGLVYVFRDDWFTPTSLPYRIGSDDIRPYLRPMSSMTSEEKEYFKYCYSLFEPDDYYHKGEYAKYMCIDDEFGENVDWLNKKMFDYRGLIKKGLALEAPEGMYEN